MPSWPEMTRRNEIFAMLQLALMKTLQFPTPIRECKMKTQATTTATSDASDSCTRQALLYLALHVLSCQFDSPTLPEAGEEVKRAEANVWDVYHMAQDPWNAAHISSDKQLVEIYEIELIMSLWLAEKRGRVACQRVPPSPHTQLSACLPFGFSIASSCRTVHSIMKKVAG